VERLWRVAARVRAERGQASRCIFCHAAEGDDEEHLVVHRGEQAFVLLNKFPYSSGHLLVAPYRHGVNFDGLDDGEIVAIHRLRRAGSRRTARGLRAGRLQPRLEHRRIAGAGIPDHGHLHVVPRWSGDTNFMPVLADVKVIPEYLAPRGRGSRLRAGVARREKRRFPLPSLCSGNRPSSST